MDFRASGTDPLWTVENFEGSLVSGVATFAKANGIATQTQWAAFIAGLTTAQGVAVLKKILGTVICQAP